MTGRYDYTPFGNEIGASVGMRETSQGYSQPTSVKQGYALTENDTNSLKHTWFRKLDSKQGRFTSPDPYNGSMSTANPQSMNRYAYVNNDPVNFVDPSGLNMAGPGSGVCASGYLTTGLLCKDGECRVVFQHLDCYQWAGSGDGGGGSRGELTGDRRRQYDDARNRIREALKKSKSCIDFLKDKLGLSASRIDRTIRGQRPFDGTTSTLSMRDAGLNPRIGLFADMTVQDFFADGTDAGAAVYAPNGRGATPRDVYFSPSGLNSTTILHEALHTFYGANLNDWDLANRLGVSREEFDAKGSRSINDALANNGCK